MSHTHTHTHTNIHFCIDERWFPVVNFQIEKDTTRNMSKWRLSAKPNHKHYTNTDRKNIERITMMMLSFKIWNMLCEQNKKKKCWASNHHHHRKTEINNWKQTYKNELKKIHTFNQLKKKEIYFFDVVVEMCNNYKKKKGKVMNKSTNRQKNKIKDWLIFFFVIPHWTTTTTKLFNLYTRIQDENRERKIWYRCCCGKTNAKKKHYIKMMMR